MWIAGLLEALAADLDAIHTHCKEKQQAPSATEPGSASLLQVFNDRPAKPQSARSGPAAATEAQSNGVPASAPSGTRNKWGSNAIEGMPGAHATYEQQGMQLPSGLQPLFTLLKPYASS